MARIRSIEPELFEHPRLARLRIEARFLYVGLICRTADDEGRFLWDVDYIRRQVFPADGVSNRQVAQWLRSVERAGLVLRYEADGQLYGFLVGWFEHQVINRPSPSKLPAPPVFPASWAEVRALRKQLLRDSRGLFPESNPRTNTVLRIFAQLSEAERQEIQGKVRPQFSECSVNAHGAFTLDRIGEDMDRRGDPPPPISPSPHASPSTPQGPEKRTLEQSARKTRRLLLPDRNGPAKARDNSKPPPDRTPSSALEQELAFVLDELLLPLFSKHPDWHNGKRMRWRKDIAYAVENGQCTLEQVRQWLSDPATRPDIGDMDVPRAWLRRMFARSRSPARARDAPGPKAPEPAGKHPSGRVEF